MSLGAIDFGLLVDGPSSCSKATLHAARRSSRPSPDEVPRGGRARRWRRAARPVAFAVAIILLVYLPLMALEGVEGKMFRPMAITVALALGGALLFTLTDLPGRLRRTRLRADQGSWRTRARGFDGAADAIVRRAASGALRRPSVPRARWRRLVAGYSRVPLASAAGRGVRAATRRGRVLVRHPPRFPSVAHLDGAAGSRSQVEDVMARFPEVTFGGDATRPRRGRDRSGRSRRNSRCGSS